MERAFNMTKQIHNRGLTYSGFRTNNLSMKSIAASVHSSNSSQSKS